MSSILGEWREGKVRPIPGNAPHDRLVSRKVISSKSICDDPFPATRFPQHQRTYRGPRYAFLEACRNLSVRCGPQTLKTWGGMPPPVGRPRAPVKGCDGMNNRILLIVRDEFRPAIA